MRLTKKALPTFHTVNTAIKPAGPTTPHINPAIKKKPAQLPLRPLQPNRFVPPRGQKQVFLPNFVITFLRTPLKPPHFASFLVPLNLNKLDLKSYLYNAYNIRVLHVRSFVMHGRMVRDPRTNRKSRKPRVKKMTIEMDGPKAAFVWPDPPEDMEPWDKKMTDMVQKQEIQRSTSTTEGGTDVKLVPTEKRKLLRRQAQDLLSGKTKWTPGWADFQRDGRPLAGM